MTFTVDFFNRDNTERISRPWRDLDVRRYSWAAIGGPHKARIRLFGNELDLWEFAEMLRSPVVIKDKARSKKVWWGYINDVALSIDGNSFKLTLDDMFNNVEVLYTLNTYSLETGFDSNADSVATYGTKDIVVTGKNLRVGEANTFRATELDRMKYPVIGNPKEISGNIDFVELTCKGWWHTLDWRYYNQDEGLEAYSETDGFYGREVGEDERPKCAQQFEISSAAGWNAKEIYLRIRKQGSPVANVTVNLTSQTANRPGGSLANKTLAHTSFSTQFEWVKFELSSTVALSPGTSYWITVEKSGAINSEDFYVVDVNSTQGYNNGVFKIYNTGTSAWETWYNQPGDMNFRVLDSISTSTQIETMIADVGEFILDTDIVDASGVERNQFRDGRNRTLYEIVELLKMGSSNSRRLLATVDENRHLRIHEEPALFAADYSFDNKRVIKDENSSFVHNSDCPVGMWLRYESLIPSTVDVSRLSQAGFAFVEQAEYRPGRNSYTIIETRDVNPFKKLFRYKRG